MAVVVCPGSFDPPTNGHIDVIERAARHFDKVLVGLTDNLSKKPMFTRERRAEMLVEVLGHLDNVEVVPFDGLLVDFAARRGIEVVVKGLRAVSDFEYELQMAQMNAVLTPSLDTVFIAARPEWAWLSSSLVKEVAGHGGDVSRLVPPVVEKALRDSN